MVKLGRVRNGASCSVPAILLAVLSQLTDSLAIALAGGLWMLTTAIIVLVVDRRCKRRSDEIARRLEVAQLGSLIDLTRHPSDTVARLAQSLVASRLPQAPSEAGRALTTEQMRAVGELARGQEDPVARNAARAAIEFIARIGDAECLPALERAASAEAIAPADKQIRAEARECLSDLRPRLALTARTATLLRPAAAPPDGSTLVRPAGHVETDETLLVRPTGGGP